MLDLLFTLLYLQRYFNGGGIVCYSDLDLISNFDSNIVLNFLQIKDFFLLNQFFYY